MLHWIDFGEDKQTNKVHSQFSFSVHGLNASPWFKIKGSGLDAKQASMRAGFSMTSLLAYQFKHQCSRISTPRTSYTWIFVLLSKCMREREDRKKQALSHKWKNGGQWREHTVSSNLLSVFWDCVCRKPFILHFQKGESRSAEIKGHHIMSGRHKWPFTITQSLSAAVLNTVPSPAITHIDTHTYTESKP